MIWIFVWIFFLFLLVFFLVFCSLKTQTHTKNENFHYSFQQKKISTPILCINLKKETKRTKFMQDQFIRFGLDYMFIDAVDKTHIANVQKGECDGVRFLNHFNPAFFTKGELACTLSHVKAIRYAYENNLGTVCICEDDTSFDLIPYWKKSLEAYFFLAPSDWKIISFYNNLQSIEKKTRLFSEIHGGEGTVFYVIHPKGQKDILESVLQSDKTFLLHPLSDSDSVLADYFIFSRVSGSYILNIPLVYPNNFFLESTLHESHTLYHQERAMKIINYYKKAAPQHTRKKMYLWVCWTGTNPMPPYLQLCYETIKKYNEPYFDIVLVHPGNLSLYVKKIHPAYQHLSYVHRADYLRCVLLHLYGGMYVDMDTLCLRPLSDIQFTSRLYQITGYDGSRWDEKWGISVMGPLKPDTPYTREWYNRVHAVLDKRLPDLQKSKEDVFGWTELLRDIVLPLQDKQTSVLIHHEDWQPFDDKYVMRHKSVDEFEKSKLGSLLILNNAMYPPGFKTLSFSEIFESDILLCSLLRYSLAKPFHLLYPFIDAVYYINLDHRKDRETQFFNEFHRYFDKDAPFHRVPAFYIRENGALGCLQSHIQLLETVLKKEPGRNILVCEDDIEFLEDPRPYLDLFFQDGHFAHFHVLMLGHNTTKSKKTVNPAVIRVLESQTCSCFLIHHNYVPVLLSVFRDALNEYLQDYIWDDRYCTDQCWKVLQQKDEWYTFTKRIARQRQGYSDIEKTNVSYECFSQEKRNISV